MTRFDNQRNTAPVLSAMKNKDLPVKHSFFDLTCNIALDAAIGPIIPFDIIETLPDSDYEIDYDILAMSRNPLVRRLLSGMTVYIHTYACSMSDLWEGFPAFVTRGRSGKVTKTVPTTVNYFTGKTANDSVRGSTPHSPSAYLGLPAKTLTLTELPSVGADASLSYVSTESSRPTIAFNCLPLVFYQQICVHNYFNSNLLQSNQNLYPEDEQHFKLSSTVTGTVYSLSYNDVLATTKPSDDDFADVAYESSDTPLILDKLQCRQFSGDDFNTGLPFPELVRGDIPSVSLTDFNGSIDLAYDDGRLVKDVGLKKSWQSAGSQSAGSAYYVSSDSTKTERADTGVFNVVSTDGSNILRNMILSPSLGLDYSGADVEPSITAAVVQPSKTSNISIQSSVTLSQLNALSVLTLFRMRMALSDGSYNSLIEAQYNKSPKMHVGKPFYIGGTKQPLVFNEVVQTSESSNDNPLGRTASRAISAGNGYIGKYHSKDFGFIMSVLCIVPDVYYDNQGLDKLWTRINQDQYVFPIMESLAPEPILNKELFYSGTENTDNDVFAYQERFYEYKSRRNRLVGNLANPNSEEDDAYAMKRHFSSTPSLSNGFATMFPSNLDYSVFSNTVDYPFLFSITSRVRGTLPLSYVSMPNDGLTRI